MSYSYRFDRPDHAVAIGGFGMGKGFIEIAGPDQFFVLTSKKGRSEAVTTDQLISTLCRQLNIEVTAIREQGRWERGYWDQGRAARVIAAALRHVNLDGAFLLKNEELENEEWDTSFDFPHPARPAYSEATIKHLGYRRSSLGETPGDSSLYELSLVKYGSTYRVLETSGDDVINEHELSAVDDEDARKRFMTKYERITDLVPVVDDEWEPDNGVLTIEHESEQGVRIWTMCRDEGAVTLETPNGTVAKGPRDIPWGREALEFLAKQCPEAWRLDEESHVSIEADADTWPWLPLYLSPEDETVEIVVNRENWCVLGWEAGGCIASPSEQLEERWASFRWSETASSTSGYDFSEIGRVTAVLARTATFIDESSRNYSFVPIDDPARLINDWLNANELVRELDGCWPGGEGLLDRGFGALLQHEKSGMSWTGLELRPTSWGEDVTGATSTAEWTFWLTTDEGIRDRLTNEYGWSEHAAPLPPARVQRVHEPDEPDYGPSESTIREVRALLSREHPRIALERAEKAYEESRNKQTAQISERKKAAEFLDLPIDSDRKSIFRRVELLTAEDPGNTAQYWYAAYDLLPSDLDGPGDAIKHVRGCQAQLAGLEDRVQAFGWPDGWDQRLLDLWVDLGGSSASAVAWANAGWSAEDVLTEPDIEGFKEETLEARVTALVVPERSA